MQTERASIQICCAKFLTRNDPDDRDIIAIFSPIGYWLVMPAAWPGGSQNGQETWNTITDFVVSKRCLQWQDFVLEVKFAAEEKCSHAETINPGDWRLCQVLADVLSVTNRSMMDERLDQIHLAFVKCICWNYLLTVRNRSLMDVRLVFCWPKARQQSIRCWSALSGVGQTIY